jgi:hypothetical protein
LFRQVYPAGDCHRALVDESELIINQAGKHNRSEMVAVQECPCATTPNTQHHSVTDLLI